jgi:hypothetical protein
VCESLIVLSFESGSILSRIEEQTLSGTAVISIVILASVEVIGEGGFEKCISPSSVPFETRSRLSRNQENVLIKNGFRGAIHQESIEETLIIND